MATYTNLIQKLYVAYFNRPADYEGLAFWEKVLTGTQGDIALVSRAFAQSPEYQELVAGKSHEQIINQIYVNLFNRDAEPGGLNFWAARLREGTFSVDQIVKVIADNASDSGAPDRNTYANKVTAATALTAEFDMAWEIVAYSGSRTNAAAKTWLSTIGDRASLDFALDPINLNDAVRVIVAEGGLIEEWIPIVLTTGVDSLQGSQGDDIFLGVVMSDATNNTLQALDSVNGGKGIDLLRILTDGSAVARPQTNGVERISLSHTQGAGPIVLDLAASRDVVRVEASDASASLTVDLSAHEGVAVRILGGKGGDTLSASMGPNARADALEGGAGDDTLVAGSNRAQLTGGAGKDLFVLAASATGAGTSSANSHSAIKDFSADDLLQLRWFNGASHSAVGKFSQLGVNLDASTAVFSNYVDAAIAQASAGEAVWFSYQGNAYVVVDSGAESTTAFVAGQDLIVQVTGVDMSKVSFNAQFGTIALA